jgi:hypothetical protein
MTHADSAVPCAAIGSARAGEYRDLDYASTRWRHKHRALALMSWSHNIAGSKISLIRGVTAVAFEHKASRRKGVLRWL